ncbi:hypothetical protein [Yinghuangia seranimata]|uniref:hypothetical protein n=1 Tax=Yinghuangia seranimata TaxID=408067 RepID=UPI00248B8196|nr:hypothetical protein [Yinghuangia seranimata]MDI2127631.1 hypothetical protein [Yinghuangia seranimata]
MPTPADSGRRLRSTAVAATLTLGLASGLTACSSGGSKQADYAEVCVHKQTMMRVADELCLSDRTGVYAWYYVPRKGSGGGTSTLPPSGSSVGSGGGTFVRPGKGSVSRGGFGGGGKGGGG